MPLPARTLTGPQPPATPLPRSRPLHTPHTKRTVSGSSSSSEQTRPDSSASVRGPLSSSAGALSAGGHELDKKVNTASIAGPTPRKPSVKAVPPRTVRKAAEPAVLPSTRKDERSLVESQSRAVLGTGPADTIKDRVLVAIRMKPPRPRSDLYGCSTESNTIWLGKEHPSLVGRGGETEGREHESEFSVDHLHLPPAPTEELYNRVVSPLVTAAMDGYDGTVFAYGMTASGKTYTMGGVPDDPGVIPRAIDQIFDVIDSDPTRETTLRVSYLELYNENFRDLLNPTAIIPPSVREVKGRIVVREVQHHTVRNPEDVQKLIKIGDANRRLGKTDWNEFSSRSHAIFTITIESRPLRIEGSEEAASGPTQFSRLNLIDLAGSERAATDVDRLKEGSYINKSLLVLGNVIEKLTESKPASKPASKRHIPYRSSKLTRLLQDSLSGHARIAVICTVSSDEAHAAEALATFKFARRVSQVVIKVERGTIATDKSMMQLYRNQVAHLTAELAKANELAALAARRLPERRDSPETEENSDDEDEGQLVEEERNRLRLIREEKAEAEREVSELELKRTKLRSELNTLSEFTLRSEHCVGPSNDGASAALPTSRRRRISDVHHNDNAQDVKAAQRRVSALGVVDEDGPGRLGRERRGGGLMSAVEEEDPSAKESALATELGEVRTQLDKLLATQSTRSSDHDVAVAAFEAQIATLRANLAALFVEREQRALLVVKLQEDLDAATAGRAQSTQQLSDLASRIVDLTQQRASADALLATHAGTIASQQTKAKEQDESIVDLRSRINELNEQQESNELSAQAQAASLSTLEDTVASLREQMREQDEHVAALKDRLADAAAAGDSSAREAASAQATLRAEVDSLTSGLAELEQRRSREVDALREAVARVEVERDTKIEEATRAEDDAARTRSSLRNEVESAEQARTVDAKTAADKIQALESELNDARSLRAADAEASAEEVDSLQAQLDEERRERTDVIEARTASLQAKVTKAEQAKVAKAKSTAEELKTLRAQLKDSRLETKAGLASAKKASAAAQSELEMVQKAHAIASGSTFQELDTLRSQLDEARSLRTADAKELSSKIANLDAQLKKALSIETTTTATVASLNQDLATTKRELSAVSDGSAENAKEAARLEMVLAVKLSELQAETERVKKLNEAATVASAERRQTEEQHKLQLQEERRRREAAIAAESAKAEDARRAKEAEAKESKDKIDALQAQWDKHLKDKAEKDARWQVRWLEIQKEKAKDEAARKAVLDDLKARLQTALDGHAALQKQIEALSSTQSPASTAGASSDEVWEREFQRKLREERDGRQCPPESFTSEAWLTGADIGLNGNSGTLLNLYVAKPANRLTIQQATDDGSLDRRTAAGLVPITLDDLPDVRKEVLAAKKNATVFMAQSTRFVMVCPRLHPNGLADDRSRSIVFGAHPDFDRSATTRHVNAEIEHAHVLEDSVERADEERLAHRRAQIEAVKKRQTDQSGSKVKI